MAKIDSRIKPIIRPKELQPDLILCSLFSCQLVCPYFVILAHVCRLNIQKIEAKEKKRTLLRILHTKNKRA